MLLSDRDIKASLDSGRIQLDPLDRDLVQPAASTYAWIACSTSLITTATR